AHLWFPRRRDDTLDVPVHAATWTPHERTEAFLSMRRGAVAALAVAAVASAAIILAVRHRTAPARRPNIVVILIDTLRRDHLPFHGYTRDTAPFLTGLAAQGVVFDQAYSTSGWTSPATASL